VTDIYDILNRAELLQEYIFSKEYLFKDFPNYTNEEKVRFELNALLITLKRLMEDFELANKNKKLIYIMDSTEYMGYVDPQNKINSYLFKIEGKRFSNNEIIEETKYRKYRYEVLFHLNLKAETGLTKPIFHERHLAEVARYKVKILLDNIKKIDQLLIKYPTLKQKIDTEEKLVEFIETEGLFNVFNNLATQMVKTKRYDDLIEHQKFTSVKKSNWGELLALNEILSTEIGTLDYNTDLYRFLIAPFSNYPDSEINIGPLKVDYKVLSYICWANRLLKKHDSKYRLALLSSNKFLTVYTKYIVDYFEKRNRNIELLNYLEDILYVRYPTVLINTINIEKSYWNKTRNDINNKLIPVISSAINQIKYGRKLKNISKQLEYISEEWGELRKAFIVHEHIEDLKELSETKEEIKKLEPAEIKSIKSIKKIGFDSIHRFLFDSSHQRISDLVNNYIGANSERFVAEFRGESKFGKPYKKEGLRWFIRSLTKGQSQFVFQLPIDMQSWISFENEKLNELRKIEDLRKESPYYYKYICILYSCISRDWHIVLPIANAILQQPESSNNNLREEILYVQSLAMRFVLCKDICSRGWKRVQLNDEITTIHLKINDALSLNADNVRIKLSEFSFRLETFVYRCHKIHDLHENYNWNDDVDYKYLIEEYNSGSLLNELEDNIDHHVFGDNLYLMYYKVLLSFYVFTKYANMLPGSELETIFVNEQKDEYVKILEELNGKIKGHHLVADFLIEICKDENRLFENVIEYRQKMETMDTNTFIKRFVLMPVCTTKRPKKRAFTSHSF